MNRIKRCILILSAFMLLPGCAGSPEEHADNAGSAADEAAQAGSADIYEEGGNGGQEMYTFFDVEGNRYEAPLLESVPKCMYDFSCLTADEATGYKSYSDAENKITARQGIDISEFQGEEIDWQQVKDAGMEFVILRLGYRAYGESGALVLDAMYEQNVQNALAAGLEVGVYFFSQAITAAEAEEEAQFVLEHVRPYNITGPVVYDTEEIKWDTARAENNTSEEYTEYCRVFCDAVRAAGYNPMIYCNLKWMAFTLDLEQLTGYDFWYADYYDIPQCPYDYKIWQYSETGVVPGINGNVDLNLWFQEGE